MKTGKELILATKAFTAENRRKSWWYTISSFLILVAFYSGSYWNVNLFAKIVCSIFAGLMIMRMFVIYHDHQHHSILNKSKLADFFFWLFGIWVLAPSSIWKRSHDYHHSHNSKLFSASIGSYPIMTKERFLSATKAERRLYLAVRHPITISLGYITMFIYGMCIKSFISNPKKHIDSLIALIVHFTIITLVWYFLGFQAAFLSVMFPCFIAFAIGAYLFYAQHNFPGVKFKNNVEWSYEHAALESSSFMKMPRFMNWLSANIGYHHIHHINSRIPFYRLPETMKKIPELQQAKVTTFRPKDIIACLKLKVWDAETNQMIPIRARVRKY